MRVRVLCLRDALMQGCVLIIWWWAAHLKLRRATKMTIEVSLLVGIVSVAFAVYFGLKSNRRNDVKDIEDRAANNAKVNMKLDNISQTVNDIKYDISTTKKEVRDLTERVVSVEQSTKSAHHRLDDFLGKVDKADAE